MASSAVSAATAKLRSMKRCCCGCWPVRTGAAVIAAFGILASCVSLLVGLGGFVGTMISIGQLGKHTAKFTAKELQRFSVNFGMYV